VTRSPWFCFIGMPLALFLSVLAFSLMIGVCASWIPATPFFQLSRCAVQALEDPQAGGDLFIETAIALMPVQVMYYLVFGIVSCTLAGAAGAAMCRSLHPGWFLVVSLPLIMLLPLRLMPWTAAWVVVWAAAGVAGAVTVRRMKSRPETPLSRPELEG